MVLAIGVVERTAIRRVADALLRHEGAIRVLQAHRRVLHIALEAKATARNGVWKQLLSRIFGPCLDFHGVAFLSQGAGIEAMTVIVLLTRINRILREVLLLQ